MADKVNAELQRPDCRFVLLTGEPGSGKTAFMAWLAQRAPDSLRYFIRRDSYSPLNSGDVQSLLLSLGHQLASRHPALYKPDRLRIVVQQQVDSIAAGGQVTGIQIDDLEVSPFYQTALQVEQHVGDVAGVLEGITVGRMVTAPRLLDPSLLQFLALLDPAALLQRDDPKRKILIFIDALDELRYQASTETALDWLATCPALPANVRIILASRPDEDLLASFRNRQKPWLREVPIVAGAEASRLDVLHYVLSWSETASGGTVLAQQQRSAEGFAETVADRAEGNFQYVVALLRALETAGDIEISDLLQIEKLPPGLDELYSSFLRLLRDSVRGERMMLGDSGNDGYVPVWDAIYRPLISVMAVARDPLSVDDLVFFGPQSRAFDRVAEAVEGLQQFLDKEDGRYRLYHASFAEYLTAGSTRASRPRDYVDPELWNRLVGIRCSQTRPLSDYGLRHAVEHLALSLKVCDNSDARDQLLGLLGDVAYAEAKVVRLGVDALLRELQLAAESGHGLAREAFRLYGQEAHNLRGWDIGKQPSLFAQNIYNRAITLGYASFAVAARDRLSELAGPHLRLRWRTLRDSPALLSTLRGHQSWAVYVALIEGKQRAVSAGRDGTVRSWDLRTGRQLWLAQVLGKSGDIWRLAVTPDGRQVLVSRGGSTPPAIIDAETGELQRPLTNHGGDAGPVAVLTDGHHLVTTSGDEVLLWSKNGDLPLRSLGRFGHLKDIAALPDGRVALLDFSGEMLTILDPASDREDTQVQIAIGRGEGNYATALASNGARAVVVRDKGPVLVIDLLAGSVERELDCGEESLFSAAITPDGRRALIGGDPTVTLWDLDNGRCLRRLSGHSVQVRGVALNADATLGVSAGADNDLRVWDLIETHPTLFEFGHAYSVNAVALSANGRRGLSASVDSLVKVFDMESGRVLRTLEGHSGIVRDVAVSADGARAVSAGLDRTLRVWDLDSGDQATLIEDHEAWITEVSVDQEDTFVSGSHDGTLRCGLDKKSRGVIYRGLAVDALALSDNGEFAVVGGQRRVERVRRSDGEMIDELAGLQGFVSNVSIEPGSRRILVSCNDGMLVLWEPDANVVRQLPPAYPSKAFPATTSGGHRGDAASAFLAPGVVAVARSYGALEIVDLDNAAVLTSVPLDHPPVSVAAACDGETLLVGDRGGDVYCFEWLDK